MHGIPSQSTASVILDEILQYRRRFSAADQDLSAENRLVRHTQLPRIEAFVAQNRPIEFVLPAFPAKSPNPNKVLGEVPDMAEKLSLTFLNEVCRTIQQHYAPGARLTICSDGHVFSDLIGVSDATINVYQDQIKALIRDENLQHLAVLNLGDIQEFSPLIGNYDALRDTLIKGYADPLDAIRDQLISDEDGTRLYRAITRFLFEDGLLPDYQGSKTALQRDARQRAYGVIQSSWAWGNLLARCFPDAIRLSIHPQPASSLKMGIHMLPTKDDWLTPWHGTAVEIDGSFVLMKKAEALEINAEPVWIDGAHSHYQVTTQPRAEVA
ncbi:isocyanide synthase family protein [Pseudomonas purpurea]|uniref:isocyanide synthase family protein n=1 Tax=Pseudomonas purpurea TaxID=3136737 RepID=UPI003267844F